ncbi:hypothetical protein WJX72_010245 [[Myrmecia] bisecta]|uniref:Uncharacterized protein n=1 Tax=[Myrmecia] bisecta TaxID=41462 RepID=A0AAW1QTF5_9CHLO
MPANRADQCGDAGLASITAAFGRPPRAQPVADVAFNPMDIAARLAGIPVYTVANKKNEFVLVSGQGDEEPKQLGLFFFSAKDAQALIDKIKEQNPKLAKQSQVLAVSLDKVYGFAITKGEADNLKNVVFRFMPDAKQVQNAMQLYQEAGVAVPGFTGVPVFQAEGLTVKTERARYTPLFFSKDDLDEAIGNAVSQRDSQRLETTKLKASRAESDLNIAQATLQESKGRGERKAAQADVSKASARLEKYVKRIDELSIKTSKPKVEVGCLEEVISKMELDDDNGDWGTVMFVPPGTITGLPDGGSSELKAAGK